MPRFHGNYGKALWLGYMVRLYGKLNGLKALWLGFMVIDIEFQFKFKGRILTLISKKFRSS